jgi:hypothetical protein
MKKIFTSIFALMLVVAVSQSSFGQAYQKGDKLVNLGIGLRSFFIPIGGSVEVGITDQISVGGLAYFAKWSDFNGNVLYLGARGSYHFNELLKINNDKLDIYGGAGLGYQNWSYKGSSLGSLSSGVYFLVHAGGRYYLNDKMGIHAELGSGVSTLLAGVSFKF